MKFLLTGCAGFIGIHAGQRSLARSDEVVGIDNFNVFYDVALKRDRVAQFIKKPNFRLIEANMVDTLAIEAALGWRLLKTVL